MAAKHRKLVFVGFESFTRPSRKQVVNTEVKVEQVERENTRLPLSLQVQNFNKTYDEIYP